MTEEIISIVLNVSYKGSAFHGFAKQEGLLTIQGELEAALSKVFGAEIEIICAGRTDAGVHALGQVVSFEVSKDKVDSIMFKKMIRSINALSHDDILVRADQSFIAPSEFSARFDAKSREYRYFLSVDEPTLYQPLLSKDFVWWIPSIHAFDLEAMNVAAKHLEGAHDFKSFCVARSTVNKNTVRELQTLRVYRDKIMGEDVICIQIVGNAFLHSMVRTIVGSLVEVGCGRKPAGWIAEVLSACDRSKAAQTAPAYGLTLWKVEY